MDIICARHGNTFAPGDRVIWVGRNQDIPLVQAGEQQARTLALALRNARIGPVAIFCAPLKRTRRYAELLAEGLGRSEAPVVDGRLTEIDYGDWAGLTNQEVEQIGHGESQRLWYEEMIWPQDANWTGSEAEIRGGVEAFLQMIRHDFRPDDTVLAVSSNGILRYFALAALGADARRDPRFPFKMRTGHVGKIREERGTASLLYWDAAPGSVSL